MKRVKIQLFVVLATALVFGGSINLFFSSNLGQTSVLSDLHDQKKQFTPKKLDSTEKVAIEKKVSDHHHFNVLANANGNANGSLFSKAPSLKPKNITGTIVLYESNNKKKVYASAKSKVILKTTGKVQAPYFTQSSGTELKDVFISVKTGKNFHNNRIHLLLQTWMSDVIEQTYIISDGFDPKLHDIFGERFVNTSCGTGHTRSSLCCKMSVEFDQFMLSKKKWFCHVDDDVYVHVGRLVGLLGRYDVTRPWYLGRVSTNEPMRVEDPDRPGAGGVTFNFGTGGAGVCLSRELARRMNAFAGGGRIMRVCDKIRLPDDCVIGYIVEHLVGVRLTEVPQLHSHLESMSVLSQQNIRDAITLSYSVGGEGPDNTVSLPPAFPPAQDPTRLKTVHCFLFPAASLCRQLGETRNSNKP